MVEALLTATGIQVRYGSNEPVLHGIDVAVARGETVGIVGESGSGKTTLGRALLRLVDITAGSIRFYGEELSRLPQEAMRPWRRRMQMIFQDPMAALNPRHTIRHILVQPLLLHGVTHTAAAAERRIASLFDRIELPLACLDRYPHELSGGQRQRVGIARAVVLEPDFVVADEIVSGLDVSTQAQVLNLLGGLAREMGLSIAFISHDLSVVRAVCDRVYVLRGGRLVESGPVEQVFAAPQAGYTRELLDAIPLPEIDPGWLRRGAAETSGATP
jgi:peptide/nickel transport system ATP-binding protein